jgi:hypothetical protein
VKKLLDEKNIDWWRQPDWFKWGTLIKKKKVMKECFNIHFNKPSKRSRTCVFLLNLMALTKMTAMVVRTEVNQCAGYTLMSPTPSSVAESILMAKALSAPEIDEITLNQWTPVEGVVVSSSDFVRSRGKRQPQGETQKQEQ